MTMTMLRMNQTSEREGGDLKEDDEKDNHDENE